MKQIIKIEDNNVFIGTETNEIIRTVLSAVSYENPQVGDNVEVYKNGDDILVVKADDETVSSNEQPVKDSKGNINYIPKKPGKKKWIFIGIGAAVLLIVIGIALSGGSKTYDWPDSEIADMLPEPEGKITALSESGGEYLDATVKIKDGYCKTYIDACIEKGFDKEKDSYNSDGDYSYTALNDEGWKLDVSSYDNEMNISLYSPEWLEDDYDDSEESDSDDSSGSSDSDSGDLIDGMRPEFKEAVDSYKDFYNDYIDFLKDYADNPTNSKLISKYSKLASKAAEMDSKLEKWDDSEMNDAEMKYYLKITGDISQKLLELSDY